MPKWAPITPSLDVAVGLRFSIGSAPKELPGFMKHKTPDDAKFQMFYHDLPLGLYRVDLMVPSEGMAALCGEIRFRKRTGHRFFFARHGEEQPFTFEKKNENQYDYLSLKLDRENQKLFAPIYIRSNKDLRFFVLRVRWLGDGDRITIRVEELVTPEVIVKEVPEFLITLPDSIKVGENSFLLLE